MEFLSYTLLLSSRTVLTCRMKYGMPPDMWKMKPMRRANRLEDEGIKMALERYCENQV